MWKFENRFYGVYWNESLGYIISHFICWQSLIVWYYEKNWLLNIPIGVMSVFYLRANFLFWRNWPCVNVKIWKQILWNLLEWNPWVHYITCHLALNSFCVMLWEELDVSGSNWGDVSGLFAGGLPSLKKLNIKRCKNLKTDSMESIGMKALGIFHHISLGDEILVVWCYERT